MLLPGFQFDDREFAKAVEFVIQETGKEAPVVINRAALHVVIGGRGFQGAMQLTPKADKSKIKALSDVTIAGYITGKLRAQGQTVDRSTFGELVVKERKRRLRAIGYTAYAGWNNAARAFGGRGLKNVTASPKKTARFGYGDKAKRSNEPTAVLTNTAPEAEKIGKRPLDVAITNVARDLNQYALGKMVDRIFNAVTPKF